MENITEKHDDLDFLASHHSAALGAEKKGKAEKANKPEDDDLAFLLSVASDTDDTLSFTGSPVVTEAEDEQESDPSEDELRMDADFELSIQPVNESDDPVSEPQREETTASPAILPELLTPESETHLPHKIDAAPPGLSAIPDEPMAFSTPTPDVRGKDSFWDRFIKWLQNSMGGTTSIGIDTSSSSSKVVSVKSTAGKFYLDDVDKVIFHNDIVLENDDDNEQARLNKVADFLLPKVNDGDWVVGGISGLDVIYRVLELPKMAKNELREAVSWAVRKDLPFEIETAELDYQILSTKKTGAVEKFEIAVLVTPKHVIENSLRFFRTINAAPAKLTSTPVAIWSVLSRLKSAGEECILVLEIGASSTHMIFVNKGHADFHREVPTACNEMIEAVSNTYFYSNELENVKNEQIVGLLDEFGILRAEELAEIETDVPLRDIQINLRPVVDRLVKEIRRSMDYYRSKYKIAQVDQIYISGGGALVHNLDSFLQTELQMDVAVLNPFELAGIRNWENFPELAKTAPLYTIPLGLAIDNFAGLNLLPEELKGAHTLRKIKRVVRWVGAFLLLVLTLYGAYVTIEKSQLSENIRQLRQQYKRLEPVRKKYLTISNRIDFVKKQIKAYNFGGAIESHAAGHLRAVSHLITKGVAISSIVVEPEIIVTEGEDAREVESGNEKITLSGIARADQAREGLNLADFLLNLEEAHYFQDIKMMNRNMRDDGTIEFVIQCIY